MFAVADTMSASEKLREKLLWWHECGIRNSGNTLEKWHRQYHLKMANNEGEHNNSSPKRSKKCETLGLDNLIKIRMEYINLGADSYKVRRIMWAVWNVDVLNLDSTIFAIIYNKNNLLDNLTLCRVCLNVD